MDTNRAAVALGTLALALRPVGRPVQAVADQHLMPGVERQVQPMAADELDPKPLETELALAAQLQDQPFFAFQDLAPGGAVRPAALLLQPGCALGLVAAPPLAQCRA